MKLSQVYMQDFDTIQEYVMNKVSLSDAKLLDMIKLYKEEFKNDDGEGSTSGMFDQYIEEYDQITKIYEERDKLIGKFKIIKQQNEKFKYFIEEFRENEKEFSVRMKTLKISQIIEDREIEKKQFLNKAAIFQNKMGSKNSPKQRRNKSSTQNKNFTCGFGLPNSKKH